MDLERRRKRSTEPKKALLLLLEAARLRSDVTSIAVVDARRNVVGGAGPARELEILREIAQPATRGLDARCRSLTEGTDLLARTVDVQGETLYLAALGTKVSKMHELARGVARILDPSASA